MTDTENVTKFINQEKRFFTKELRELQNVVPQDAQDDYVRGTSAARCNCRNAIAACDTILSALRAQQEREKLQPLSLDELREMDGEPIWIESGDGAVCAYSGWAIVGRYYDDSVALYVPDNVYYEPAVRHGTVIVYAHKPGGARK